MLDYRNTYLADGSQNAFLTTLADAKRKLRDSVGYSGQKICREPLTMINIAMIFKKSFPLKSVIDNELKKLTTHGIVQRWFKYFINKEFKTYNHKFKLDPKSTSGPLVLQFSHLEGVFIIGLGGLIISSAVFVVEILLGRITKKVVPKVTWSKLYRPQASKSK